MPSTTAINIVGAFGGAVLAACLLPQLWRLYRTRSARDLSYPYIVAYSVGLLLTFLYLYWEGATVAWICSLLELACAVGVLIAKVYLDNYGPYSERGRLAKAAREEGAEPDGHPAGPSAEQGGEA